MDDDGLAKAIDSQIPEDVEDFVEDLEENIKNTQWMCGFPDTLIVASVGNEYIVSAFGNAEIVETFKTIKELNLKNWQVKNVIKLKAYIFLGLLSPMSLRPLFSTMLVARTRETLVFLTFWSCARSTGQS